MLAPASSNGSGRLALLIDAENVSPKVVGGLLAEVAGYGVAGVKRVYGDWTGPNLKGWKERLLEHSLQPVQQFACVAGKNAADGAMIIDAMDLLYTGRFSGFCIVSSDSDFARLAARIKEQGLTVYGFGERKTPRPFVAACDRFVYFDVLGAPVAEAEPPVLLTVAKATPAKPAPKATTTARKLDEAARSMLAKAVAACAGEDGRAHLGNVGNVLAKQYPGFDSRRYGYSRLSDLVKATDLVLVELGGKDSKVITVRLKP